ncbi:ssk1 response regulator receiver [Serendipita sp. 399]|nr:ssk1 response regulator receiver [Serendipita sp. 399]
MSQFALGLHERGEFPPSVSIDTHSVPLASLAETQRPGLRQGHELAHESAPNLPVGTLPRLSRSFSMPIPSRLGHLQRPRLPEEPSLSQSDLALLCNKISVEIADSVQMVIQTLLQISPPHLLDPAKEQLSGCILQVPTPSISSLFTSMKILNYISKNLLPLFESPHPLPIPSTTISDEFDAGELLQSMGDALSGIAAEFGVDLVIFHGDPGLQDLAIQADECGLLYTLTFIARQILTQATRGDVVEIGLRIKPARDSPLLFQGKSDPEIQGNICCEFEFRHKSNADRVNSERWVNPLSRLNMSNPVLGRLISFLHADFSTTPPSPDDPALIGRYLLISPARHGISTSLLHSIPEEEEIRQPFPELHLAREPTINELSEFANKLKGRKASFYASTKSSFAHYLTIYLTEWGMDVTHMPSVSGLSTPPTAFSEKELVSLEQNREPRVSNSLKDTSAVFDHNLTSSSFVIIDDNLAVLRARLSEMHVPFFQILQDNRLKRPSLAANHRPKSSSSLIRRVVTSTPDTSKPINAPVIVYFTSLSKYREVKDLVQAIAMSRAGKQPEIIVIPKPAGVRRFLTALYTATTKPLVDPVFFSPIATSPMSPRGHILSPFLPQTPRSPHAPVSPLLASELTTDISAASSPSGTPTPIQTLSSSGGPNDYFEREGSKIAGSVASGLFMKSADGKTGIFFQPPSKESTSGAISPSKEVVSATTTKKAIAKTGIVQSTITTPQKDSSKSPAEPMSTSLERVAQHEVLPWSLPNALTDQSNSVFVKGPPTDQPPKPIKASIVGVKVKQQVEVVVPPIRVLIVEGELIPRYNRDLTQIR